MAFRVARKARTRARVPEGVNFDSYAFNYDATQLFAALALENFPVDPYEKIWEITRMRSWKSKKKLPFNTAVLWGPYAINYIKSKYLRLWKLRDPAHPHLESVKEVFDGDSPAGVKIDLGDWEMERMANLLPRFVRQRFTARQFRASAATKKKRRLAFVLTMVPRSRRTAERDC